MGDVELHDVIVTIGNEDGKADVSSTELGRDDPTEPTPDKQKVIKRKEKPLSDATLLLAATLVLDAKAGHNMHYLPNEKYVKSYNLYNSAYLRLALYFFIAFNLSLVIFEKPAVPNTAIPFWLTILDMICYTAWIYVAPDTHPIRWSRPLRPLFIINFPDGKQIRRAFRNIRRTVVDVMNVLLLFLLSILLFGLLALKLFNKREISYHSGRPYFRNYIECVWDLYVLVTTANNPDVMMPAYDENNWFALFFIIYLIICLYIFMSIVLATTYTNYKKNLRYDVKAAVFLKREKLEKAFELLTEDQENKEVLTYSTWRQLVRRILPQKSDVHTDLLMKILDQENKNMLSEHH